MNFLILSLILIHMYLSPLNVLWHCPDVFVIVTSIVAELAKSFLLSTNMALCFLHIQLLFPHHCYETSLLILATPAAFQLF